MFERYGEEWTKYCTHKAKNFDSRFDNAVKQFSPQPKKSNVNFQDYSQELKKCIQEGIQPVFGYPLPEIIERDF